MVAGMFRRALNVGSLGMLGKSAGAKARKALSRAEKALARDQAEAEVTVSKRAAALAVARERLAAIESAQKKAKRFRRRKNRAGDQAG